MSILGTISSFLGTSQSHYASASNHFESAKDHGSQAIKGTGEVAANFFTFNTVLGAGAAWNSFEFVAGKIVSSNAAIQFANMFTNGSLGYIAQATNFAANTLVNHAVGSMGVLLVTSVLASNPTATFKAIKKAGSIAYDFMASGAEAIAATTETVIGATASLVEIADEYFGDEQTEFEMKEMDSMGEYVVDTSIDIV